MINFKSDNYIFNVRASGFLLCENRLLLQRLQDSQEWSLPGGRVELGESTEDAYIREVFEETGLAITCHKLFVILEHRFSRGNRKYHEINFYYEAVVETDKYINEETLSLEADSNLIFQWHDLESVHRLETFPGPVFRKYLTNSPPRNLVHMTMG